MDETIKKILLDSNTTPRPFWRILLTALLFIPISEIAGLTLSSLIPTSTKLSIFLTGTGQLTFFLILLYGWLKLVNKHFTDIGFNKKRKWVSEFTLSIGILLIIYVIWFLLAETLNIGTINLKIDGPEFTLITLAILFNVIVQDTVFFGLIVGDALEGLTNRGLNTMTTILLSILTGCIFFILLHGGPFTTLKILNLTIGGILFALPYIHTGRLGMTIGLHFGNNIIASAVTTNIDGILALGFWKLLAAYIIIITIYHTLSNKKPPPLPRTD